MNLEKNLIINTYSIALLIIIYFHSKKHNEKELMQYKLYMGMISITILMLAMDTFSRFDGIANAIYPIFNHCGNFMIFLLSPILPSLWVLYVHDQIFQNEQKTRKLIYPLVAINVVSAVLLVFTQFFGGFYYIDSNNIYHRGPLFLLSASCTITLIFVSFAILIANRKKIDNKHFFILVLFAVVPFVCIIWQILFYGMSIMLNAVVLSMLILLLNIQDQNIYTDYLTGVYNRKKLELYLKEKINTSTENKTFSAIMVDLNNFKSINDDYGHDIGDNALKVTTKLLNSCIRPNDFIARFGGDEFYIVLDISNMKDLEGMISRINRRVVKYNASCDQPYMLGFSMGYAVYNFHSGMNSEEYQKQIDVLMYKNKQDNKEIKKNIHISSKLLSQH